MARVVLPDSKSTCNSRDFDHTCQWMSLENIISLINNNNNVADIAVRYKKWEDSKASLYISSGIGDFESGFDIKYTHRSENYCPPAPISGEFSEKVAIMNIEIATESSGLSTSILIYDICRPMSHLPRNRSPTWGRPTGFYSASIPNSSRYLRCGGMYLLLKYNMTPHL
jgi:hypothetical protein